MKVFIFGVEFVFDTIRAGELLGDEDGVGMREDIGNSFLGVGVGVFICGEGINVTVGVGLAK